ncbi:MAG: hypothetical protein QM640_00865 [Niabella sp.]
MLEQILDLVKQYGQQSVVNNPQIPDENNNAVLSDAATSVASGLQSTISGGGLQNIISMFTGNQNQNSLLSNPVVGNIISQFTNSLLQRNANLDPNAANGIAASLIPGVIGALVNNIRSNDPAHDSFDLNDLISTFTGGNATADNTQTHGFDFQGLISQFTGGGSTSAPDLSNVINTITQRSQQEQQQQQSGGLADLIQGFFK